VTRVKPPSDAHQRRKAEILAAAGEVFYQKGYHGASMQDIADRLEILKAGLYYYVDSKEDLLYQLAVQLTEEAFEFHCSADAALAEADAETRLRDFIRQWILTRVNYESRAFLAVEQDCRQLSADRWTEVRAHRNKLRLLLKGILEQGLAEEIFDPDMNIDVVATNVFELLVGISRWYKPSGPCSLQQLSEWYATFIIRGIMLNPG